MVRYRIERKLRLYRGEISEKKIASLYRSLLAAGFPTDIVRKELFRMTRKKSPNLIPNDDCLESSRLPFAAHLARGSTAPVGIS